MANTKFTSLTSATTVTTTDVLALAEVIGTATPTSKKVTVDQLKSFVHAGDQRLTGVLTETASVDTNNYVPTTSGTATDFANNSIIRFTPTASFALSGLANGANGMIRTLCNASTDFCIILTHRDPSSTTASQFDFGQMLPFYALLPGESATFWYDATTPGWRYWQGSHAATLSGQFDEFSDLLTGIEVTEISGNPIGPLTGVFSAGTIDVTNVGADGNEKSQGVIRLATGASAAGRAHLVSGATNGIVPAQSGVLMATRCSVPTLSSATEAFQVRVGLQDSSNSSTVTDGVYWEYDQSQATTWRKCTSVGGSHTANADAGFTVVATVNNYLGLWVNPAWTRVDFFHSVDGVSWSVAADGASTATMPTVTDLVELGAGINKTAGTTARQLDVDWIGWRFHNQQR